VVKQSNPNSQVDSTDIFHHRFDCNKTYDEIGNDYWSTNILQLNIFRKMPIFVISRAMKTTHSTKQNTPRKASNLALPERGISFSI